tara:strand:- start:21962 stop:22720 length:759 start_codon:yes stop_codon:yes gene_type:complete
MNIQKTLDSLQPYVIGIRYLDGTPLVDVVFKDGWNVPDDQKIKKVKGDDNMNYYMLLSEIPGVGLDELLAFVERTIKLNIERENKHDLLKVKFAELKDIFKGASLEKLKHLKFVFGDEDLVPSLNEFDIDIVDIDEEPVPLENVVVEDYQPYQDFEEVKESQTPIEYTPYVDENGKSIELSEDDIEGLAEEARAEKNMLYLENKNKKTSTNKIARKVELPPKRKPVSESTINHGECVCGPDDACDKCIDNKY